jgi:hypothetical protein
MFADVSKKPDIFIFRVEKKSLANIKILKNSFTLKIGSGFHQKVGKYLPENMASHYRR